MIRESNNKAKNGKTAELSDIVSEMMNAVGGAGVDMTTGPSKSDYSRKIYSSRMGI